MKDQNRNPTYHQRCEIFRAFRFESIIPGGSMNVKLYTDHSFITLHDISKMNLVV